MGNNRLVEVLRLAAIGAAHEMSESVTNLHDFWGDRAVGHIPDAARIQRPATPLDSKHSPRGFRIKLADMFVLFL
jgi:hypothetical protein